MPKELLMRAVLNAMLRSLILPPPLLSEKGAADLYTSKLPIPSRNGLIGFLNSFPATLTLFPDRLRKATA